MRRGTIPGSTGTVRPVRLLGDPVLSAASAEVTEFGDGLARLVEDMFATMYAADGVGLAAPQIGVPLRVFVYDCPDDEERRHIGHVVNPRVTAADGVTITGTEGCLSLPGVYASTTRFDRTAVEGADAYGEAVSVTGTGFFARCLQHECDHLDGGLFTDRLTGLRRRRAMRVARRAPWSRGDVRGGGDEA